MTLIPRRAWPALFAAACLATPVLAQPGPAAPFAGEWRSSERGDQGMEIRTEGARFFALRRFARGRATCMEGAAGRVTAPDTATLEGRRVTCTDGTEQAGGGACTLVLTAPDRMTVTCAGEAGTRVLRKVR